MGSLCLDTWGVIKTGCLRLSVNGTNPTGKVPIVGVDDILEVQWVSYDLVVLFFTVWIDITFHYRGRFNIRYIERIWQQTWHKTIVQLLKLYRRIKENALNIVRKGILRTKWNHTCIHTENLWRNDKYLWGIWRKLKQIRKFRERRGIRKRKKYPRNI